MPKITKFCVGLIVISSDDEAEIEMDDDDIEVVGEWNVREQNEQEQGKLY